MLLYYTKTYFDKETIKSMNNFVQEKVNSEKEEERECDTSFENDNFTNIRIVNWHGTGQLIEKIRINKGIRQSNFFHPTRMK